MPPKPWLAKTGPPRQDVSAIIQSNPTMKQQIPKLSMQSPISGPMTNEQSMTGTTIPGTTNTTNAGMTGALGTTGLGGTSAYGSLGSGYGSYGGGMSSYGGGYGGYGSSYGGYGSSMMGGGYGSSYGMGGYGSSYGMGGYGRMGMMGGGDPNKPNFVMNTLMTLQSLGFLIGSFCQIGRSLDHNIEGLHLFFNSFKNLFKKIYDGIKGFGSWIGEKTKNLLLGILNFIKTYVLFMKHEDPKNRMKSLKLVINVCVVVLVISLYPQIKKVLNKTA